MRINHDTGNNFVLVAYVILMIAAVVAVDLIFFRHRFRERLIANVAIVSVFLVFYLVVLRHK